MWCKDVWKMPSLNFTQIMEQDSRYHLKCNKLPQLENFVPNGQDILAIDIGVGLVHNCFNRADSDPFKKIGYNQSEDGGDKSWSDWVRTPCQYVGTRRCIGQKPSQCVDSYGWYI